jgi:hypothetical protein
VIHVDPIPEPEGFDAEVRQRGQVWLAEHPKAARPRPLWSPYLPHLAAGFRHLCAYSAMHIEDDGTVDHYQSCATHRALTYEWSNYRFTSARMNSVKGTANGRVLDPFEIGDDWFDILLPSLQMVPTDRIPPEQRERAAFTLKRLGLRDGESILRRRRAWYEQFLSGKQSLDGLRHTAPLIARAVEKRLSRIEPAVLGEAVAHYERLLRSELTFSGLKSAAPEVFLVVEAALRSSL